MTKTGQLITCNNNHMNVTPITAELYLWHQLSKARHTDTLQGNLKPYDNGPQQGHNTEWTESDHKTLTNESPFSES